MTKKKYEEFALELPPNVFDALTLLEKYNDDFNKDDWINKCVIRYADALTQMHRIEIHLELVSNVLSRLSPSSADKLKLLKTTAALYKLVQEFCTDEYPEMEGLPQLNPNQSAELDALLAPESE